MKSVVFPSLALAAAVVSLPSQAQQPSNPPSPATSSAMRQPWYGGISVGQSKLNNACVDPFSCDDKDTAYRLFAGTHFNRWLGLELGAANLGKWDRAGGQTKAWAADITGTAGIPLGSNASVFAKLGAAYTQSDVSGTAPGLETGKEHDWSPRYGVGGQLGLSQNWALRADWDRYQNVSFRGGGDEDVDIFSVGLQYTFR
jgi:OOP family OmpA-OmpF porin